MGDAYSENEALLSEQAGGAPLRQIDLTPFCDVGGIALYELTTPWMAEGAACATDGCILVAVEPARAAPFAPADGARPDVSDILALADSREAPNELPPIPDISFADQWWRRSICEDCECFMADIESQAREPIFIGKAEYQRRYLFLISRLPGVRVSEPDDPRCTLVFRFDGGRGALQPLCDNRDEDGFDKHEIY